MLHEANIAAVTTGTDVLVVEDSTFFRSLVEKQVRKAIGVEVVAVATLAEAKEVLQTNSGRFFLALLDLNLPDAPKGEVVDLVMDENIPVVVFTGTYDETLREQLLSREVIDYVVKDSPASLSYLVSMVRRIHRNRNITALIVDDSKTARSYTRSLLELYQFRVREAGNGVEALKVIEEDPSIRLVLTDYNMPEMDGFELTTYLRKTYSRDALAIIGLSTSGSAPLSAKFIKQGANDFLNKPFLPEEFFCRISQNLDMQENTRELAEAASTDFLTGLSNRRHFFEAGETFLAAGRRSKSEPVLAIVDIDNFKVVNDTYGHDIGDEVLEAIAHRIGGALLRDTDIAARIGGEEFALFAYDMTAESVESFFESLREAIEAVCVETAKGPVQVTVSIGVCSEVCETIEEMLKAADVNLYKAKSNGRNCVVAA